MSAIREVIEILRNGLAKDIRYPPGREELDAAEAELKGLEALVKNYANGADQEFVALTGARAQLAERDQADAELRETLERYKSHDCGHGHLIGAVYKWAAKGAVK